MGSSQRRGRVRDEKENGGQSQILAAGVLRQLLRESALKVAAILFLPDCNLKNPGKYGGFQLLVKWFNFSSNC